MQAKTPLSASLSEKSTLELAKEDNFIKLGEAQNSDEFILFLQSLSVEKRKALFEAHSFVSIAAMTTKFETLITFLGLLPPEQQIDYLLEIDKTSDNHLFNLLTTFDEFEKIFKKLSPIQQGNFLLLIEVRKIAALITNYSQLSFLLSRLNQITIQYVQPLPPRENTLKPLSSIVIKYMNHITQKENETRILQLKTAYTNQLAIDIIAPKINEQNELYSFLNLLPPDKQRVCLQNLSNPGKLISDCSVLAGVLILLSINVIPDIFNVIDIHSIIQDQSKREYISSQLSFMAQVILLQVIGPPIKTQQGFINRLKHSKVNCFFASDDEVCFFKELPKVNYSFNSHTLIFNLYELFFHALHLLPEQKNAFGQMLDDKLVNLIAQSDGHQLCEVLQALTQSQVQKDICFKNIGFERIGGIIKNIDELVSVLNCLQGESCAQTLKEVWLTNYRSQILHNPKHPLHVSCAWDDAKNFLDNLKNLFALPLIQVRVPEINKRIHAAISTANSLEIKSMLVFLEKELKAIDDQTTLPPQTASRFKLFTPKPLPATGDIALRLQFAIGKLQALLAPQQMLEPQSSSSTNMQLRA